MKPGDLVSTPDGIGEIVIATPGGSFGILLDSSRPGDGLLWYYGFEITLVYSQK
jgi:hypothetical protein